MAPDVAAEADGQETAVLVGHLHQVGKQGPAGSSRRRTLVASLFEAPELLGIVPAKEVGIALEEVFERLQVAVLDVRMTATGRLAGKPHAVLLADGRPRLIGAHSRTRPGIDILILIVCTRQREVHTYVWPDILRNEVDNLLRVSIEPHVNVYQPQRMFVVNRTALLGHSTLPDHQGQQ